jgi:hypothetical protein
MLALGLLIDSTGLHTSFGMIQITNDHLYPVPRSRLSLTLVWIESTPHERMLAPHELEKLNRLRVNRAPPSRKAGVDSKG